MIFGRTFVTSMRVDMDPEADRSMKQFLAIRALVFLFLASTFLRWRGDHGRFTLRLLIVVGLV
jgi:hypothetical protein